VLLLDLLHRSRRELDWPVVIGIPRLEAVEFDGQHVMLSIEVQISRLLELFGAVFDLQQAVVRLHTRVVIGAEYHPVSGVLRLVSWDAVAAVVGEGRESQEEDDLFAVQLGLLSHDHAWVTLGAVIAVLGCHPGMEGGALRDYLWELEYHPFLDVFPDQACGLWVRWQRRSFLSPVGQPL